MNNPEAGALISAGSGIRLGSNSADWTDMVTFTNAGAVTAYNSGVYIETQGTVINTGQITSTDLNGVQLDAFGTVSNQGTISGARSGARLFDGGFVYNQEGALLAGGRLFGVEITGAYGKVINCGSISSAQGAGVYLADGGLVVNETGAIRGATVGVKIAGAAGNIANAASIRGVVLARVAEFDHRRSNAATGVDPAAAGGYGVSFYNGAGPVAADLHNKGRIDGVLAFSGDPGSSIDGSIGGVGAADGPPAAVTVTNAGTIRGAANLAVQFKGPGDRLIVEAGAHFVGAVVGGGGALELAGGTGTLSGLGGAGKLTGAAAMSFSGFGSYAIDKGASWTLGGADALDLGQTISVAGTLTLAGTVKNDGVVSGAKGSTITLKKGDVVGGTLSSAGPSVSGGGNLLDGIGSTLANRAKVTLADAATLTIQGAIANSGSITLAGKTAATRLVVGKAGATLSGAGQIVMGAGTFNTIIGANASAILTNSNDTISGVGQLGGGQMVLVNKKSEDHRGEGNRDAGHQRRRQDRR